MYQQGENRICKIEEKQDFQHDVQEFTRTATKTCIIQMYEEKSSMTLLFSNPYFFSFILQKERQDASAYKCDECGRGFQWKRDLAQHKRLHTGEKLLICSVCGKKFTTRQALLHHVVVHTGEKPFQCAVCGNK